MAGPQVRDLFSIKEVVAVPYTSETALLLTLETTLAVWQVFYLSVR